MLETPSAESKQLSISKNRRSDGHIQASSKDRKKIRSMKIPGHRLETVGFFLLDPFSVLSAHEKCSRFIFFN